MQQVQPGNAHAVLPVKNTARRLSDAPGHEYKCDVSAVYLQCPGEILI